MNKILERGVEEIIDKRHLDESLKRGDKLRVKLGIDPTAKDLHLGHTVVLRKLRQFQDTGHQAVLIIGDFTAAIGDPSGRNELRPPLTSEQIKENMRNYLREVGKVLDIKKTEVHHNSEWYKDKDLNFLMELASKFTITRLLERDDFQKRLKEGMDVSLVEILYQIIQGYDSLAINADLELGGTDQKFNLLMGRKVQKRYNQPEQDILTVPLIEGLDGTKKMSKSTGNYIGLSESSRDIFGKIMSLPDSLMVKYFTLLTDVPEEEISKLKSDLTNPSSAKKSPKEWKEKLASEIVRMYCSQEEAVIVKDEFTRIFSGRQLPDKIGEYYLQDGDTIVDVITKRGLAGSKTEAKRLVDQKAVEVNNEKLSDWGYKVKEGDVIKVGPRKFLKIV